MGQIITAPNCWEFDETAGRGPAVFLAGGISHCPEWQGPLADELAKDLDITVLNPRRNDWDMNADAEESRAQIYWEFGHLRLASHAFFWFPCETDCPITLFELGSVLERDMNVIIGCHPDYRRKFDVEIQTLLRRPGPTSIIFDDLKMMTYLFKERFKAGK